MSRLTCKLPIMLNCHLTDFFRLGGMGKNTSLPVYDREGHESTSDAMDSPGQSVTNIGVDTLEGNVDVKILDLEVQIAGLRSDLAKEKLEKAAERKHRKSEIKALQEQVIRNKKDLDILREQIVNTAVPEGTNCGCNNEMKVLKDKLASLTREFAVHKAAGPSHRPNSASTQAACSRSRPYCAFVQPGKMMGHPTGSSNTNQRLRSTPIEQPRPGLRNIKKIHRTHPPGRGQSASHLSDSSEPSGNHQSTSTPDEASSRSPAQKRPKPAPPVNEASKRSKSMRPTTSNPPREVDDESEQSDNDDVEVVREILNQTARTLQSVSSSASDNSQISNTLEEYGKGVFEAGMKGWKPQKISVDEKKKILREMTTVENMHRITMENCLSAIEDSIWPDILRKAIPEITDSRLNELIDFLANTSRRSVPFVKLLKGIINPHKDLCRKCPNRRMANE